jgi:WD40 repeat protein
LGMVGVKLQDDIVRSFGMGRVFKVCASWFAQAYAVTCRKHLDQLRQMALLLPLQENTGCINSLDFHRQEDLLVTACEDDSVHLYNIESGTVDKTVFSRKYGVAHIRFTHHPYSVVYASNKASCAVAWLRT